MQVTNETRALAHEILAYWLRFNKHDQRLWVGSHPSVVPVNLGNKEVNVCNTTMCAAGTAVFLSVNPLAFVKAEDEYTFHDWLTVGGELLGLDRREAELVFLSDNKSAKRYMRAIAAGSQEKFDRATYKRVSVDD